VSLGLLQDLPPPVPGTEAPQNTLVGRHGVGGAYVGLLGREPTVLGLRQQ